jgi:hypothetical protein
MTSYMQQAFAPEPHSMMIKTPFYASEAQLAADVPSEDAALDTTDFESNPQYIRAMDTGKWTHVSRRPGARIGVPCYHGMSISGCVCILAPTLFCSVTFTDLVRLFPGVCCRPPFSPDVVAVLC